MTGAARPGQRAGAGWPDSAAEPAAAPRIRLALSVAILTVLFEMAPRLPGALAADDWIYAGATALVAAAALAALAPKMGRGGPVLFALALVPVLAAGWASYHNHGWLTVWTIPAAALFGAAWWGSAAYHWYLRMTLGLVMLGACAQKLLAGTYLDGSYIAYLGEAGALSERFFALAGGGIAGPAPGHAILGTAIVVWQGLVGVLLVWGLRSLPFLAIEIAFLLSAGLIADELNFQVLVVALLCIGFGVGMRRWLLIACLGCLVLDLVSVSRLIGYAL